MPLMKLKTGKLDNRERKFIYDPDKITRSLQGQFIRSLGEDLSTFYIMQFYLGDAKYRCLIDPMKPTDENLPKKDEWGTQVMGFTKNIKNGDITEVTQITEKEYNEASFKNNQIISTKTRISYRIIKNGDEFNVDIDEYFRPRETIIEVSGENLESFVPPEFLKEVTGDANYSAKGLYETLKKTVIEEANTRQEIINGTGGYQKP